MGIAAPAAPVMKGIKISARQEIALLILIDEEGTFSIPALPRSAERQAGHGIHDWFNAALVLAVHLREFIRTLMASNALVRAVDALVILGHLIQGDGQKADSRAPFMRKPEDHKALGVAIRPSAAPNALKIAHLSVMACNRKRSGSLSAQLSAQIRRSPLATYHPPRKNAPTARLAGRSHRPVCFETLTGIG